jgi:hypothetical protein
MAAARSNARPASLSGWFVRMCLRARWGDERGIAYSAFAFGMRLQLGCIGLRHSRISLFALQIN